MNNRLDRVNSLLEHEISNILLKEFSFLEAIATLTRVDTAPNLISTKVYISVFPENKAEKAIEALNKNIHSIQQKINKKLNMRPIPKIIFVKDNQVSQASKVEEILSSLKDLKKEDK